MARFPYQFQNEGLPPCEVTGTLLIFHRKEKCLKLLLKPYVKPDAVNLGSLQFCDTSQTQIFHLENARSAAIQNMNFYFQRLDLTIKENTKRHLFQCSSSHNTKLQYIVKLLFNYQPAIPDPSNSKGGPRNLAYIKS